MEKMCIEKHENMRCFRINILKGIIAAIHHPVNVAAGPHRACAQKEGPERRRLPPPAVTPGVARPFHHGSPTPNYSHSKPWRFLFLMTRHYFLFI